MSSQSRILLPSTAVLGRPSTKQFSSSRRRSSGVSSKSLAVCRLRTKSLGSKALAACQRGANSSLGMYNSYPSILTGTSLVMTSLSGSTWHSIARILTPTCCASWRAWPNSGWVSQLGAKYLPPVNWMTKMTAAS